MKLENIVRQKTRAIPSQQHLIDTIALPQHQVPNTSLDMPGPLSSSSESVLAPSSSPMPTQAATPQPAPAPVPAPVLDLNLADLELMMNWYSIDIHPFSTDLEYKIVWQEALRRESLTYPFLMHGILAVSGLELGRRSGCNASNIKQQLYLALALGHHSRAVALSQPLLGNINEENCKAVFLVSILLTVFAFGSSQVLNSGDACNSINQLHLVFLLARGMQQAYSTAADQIKGGAFDVIMKLDDYTPWLPHDAMTALRKLSQHNKNYKRYTVQNEKNAYETAIDLVQFIFKQIHGGSTRPNPVITWATTVPPLYLELMRARRPMALVILAHYCVALHHLRGIWWVDGWSVPLLREIWSSLDGEWRKSLRWVVAVTKFTP